MKMKTGFRNTQWDPLLLIAQIIAFQSILYVCLGFLMAFMDILVGANHTLDHLFQYHVSNFQSHSIHFSKLCKNFELIVFFSFFNRRFMSPTRAADLLFSRLYWMLLLAHWPCDILLDEQNFAWTSPAHIIWSICSSVGFTMVHFRRHFHGGFWTQFVPRWCACAVNFYACKVSWRRFQLAIHRLIPKQIYEITPKCSMVTRFRQMTHPQQQQRKQRNC